MDFIKNVAQNLNFEGCGHWYYENNKSFDKVMKVYGDKRMCDAFNLNYSGLNYSTIKRDHKKGIQFTRRKTCPLQLLIFSCSGQVANKLQVVVVF